MKKIRLEYPSWHDAARKDREVLGYSLEKLADKYGVSKGLMGHIATPNWRSYLILRTQRDLTVKDATGKLNTGNFEFVSVPTPPADGNMAKRVRKWKDNHFFEEENMLRERDFTPVKDFHEGKALVGAQIQCSKCGSTEKYFNYKGSVTPGHLPKEFERRGWQVGKSARTDMCSSCLSKLKGRKSKPVITIEMDVPVPSENHNGHIVLKPVPVPEHQAIPVIPAPTGTAIVKAVPVMTRTDDRIIMSKLEDVYIDESVGYKDDWTDEKVAKDLNVPIDWIATIRERSFGPEISASSQNEMNEIIELGEGVMRQIVLAEKKIEQMSSLDKKISDLSDEINAKTEELYGRIDRFDQLMKSLEVEDGKVTEIIKDFHAKAAEFKVLFSNTEKAAPARRRQF